MTTDQKIKQDETVAEREAAELADIITEHNCFWGDEPHTPKGVKMTPAQVRGMIYDAMCIMIERRSAEVVRAEAEDIAFQCQEGR
jgi:hypothetical protein